MGRVWELYYDGFKKVLKHYGFDPKFRRSAEWDLAIRVAYQGGYFIAVDQPLVIQHKTPTFDKAGRKPLDYALMLRKKHKAYLQKNKVYWGLFSRLIQDSIILEASYGKVVRALL